MWFLGLVFGMLFGGMALGAAGVVLGGVLGLLAGIWLGNQNKTAAAGKPPSGFSFSADAERIRLLERQV